MSTVWNAADKSASITLSDTNHTATSTAGGNLGVRATPTSHATGKWYIEYTNILTPGGSGQYGFAASGDALGGGGQCGVSAGGFVNKTGGATVNLGSIPDGHTTTSICLDLDNNKIWARYDGGNWNNSGTDNPATNTGGVSIAGLTTPVVPYTWLQNNPGHVNINAGDRAFNQAIPSGFTAWDFVPPYTQTQAAVLS